MCGIYGFLDRSGAPVPRELLTAMGNRIVHRGPDDEGLHVDGAFGFGMRRLSIIDLSGGHQPIFNEDRSVVVVCNGEIYNFRELRAELEAKGHRFSTGSDSEVGLHAYEEYGDDFVRRLDGMFGIAIWDARRRRLVVARDPLGIKPLYLRRRPDGIAFASEAKSLLALPGVSARIDPIALSDYLTLGYVPAPRSMFEGIEKLEPGHMMVVERGEATIRRYWQLDCRPDDGPDDQEWSRRIRADLERAVDAQMVSDVPIGAFLSGGVDSSTVVALMARAAPAEKIRTFAIGFEGSSGSAVYNELPHARRVAQMFGTNHREIMVRPDVVGLLPKIAWHLDEPIADSASLTTWLVSEFARREVTVILSGVGGDELFAGYNRYLDGAYRRRYEYIPSLLRRGLIEPLLERLPSDRHHPLFRRFRYAKAFVAAQSLSPEARYRSYVQAFSERELASLLRTPVPSTMAIERAFAFVTGNGAADDVSTTMAVDLVTQLPDDLLALTDRMSMAVSLECRVPLLDQRLVETAARIPGARRMPGGRLKHLMKAAVADLLPAEILDRQKRGFGAPVGAWLKTELLGVVREVLSREAIDRRGLLDSAHVSRLVEEHRSGREDRSDHLLALIGLEVWCRIYLDSHAAEDVADELTRLAAA